MVREISSGGVVLREISDTWHVALIEPQKESPATAKGPRKRVKAALALPKGLVDPGETAPVTAIREVHEETGIVAELIAKLADIKYVYVRTWAGGERVFKIVSFYLLHYEAGEIDDIAPEMRIEVARAHWVPLEDAPKLLAYKGEKDVVRRALEYVKTHLVPEAST